MESKNNNKIEKLQELKDQAILRSKQADNSEDSRYQLCLADIYTLAMQKENIQLFGSSITSIVGGDTDAVTCVSISIRPNFKERTFYFETSFSQYSAVPGELVRKVREKEFNSAEDAYEFITGLAENINKFFNNIKL